MDKWKGEAGRQIGKRMCDESIVSYFLRLVTA
jgi:hypothetical protein